MDLIENEFRMISMIQRTCVLVAKNVIKRRGKKFQAAYVVRGIIKPKKMVLDNILSIDLNNHYLGHI